MIWLRLRSSLRNGIYCCKQQDGAAGENPEWIARQLGHSSTKMLFERYSRFVPNVTRQDGSAFEALLVGF